MPFYSTKTYGHEVGLSVCFRQHRATHSHCSKLHGYALSVKLTFGCIELDMRNWVVDFGSLKAIKSFLVARFDHKLVIAEDDPAIEYFAKLQAAGLADLIVLPQVGCEAFAKYIFDWIERLFENGWPANVWIESVEVAEHGANSAIYQKERYDVTTD